MLDRFQDQGVTDYLAFAVRVGESIRVGAAEGLVGVVDDGRARRIY